MVAIIVPWGWCCAICELTDFYVLTDSMAVNQEHGSSTLTDPKALYEDKCSACHSLNVVEGASYITLDEWQDIVNNMQAINNTFSATEATTIAKYLTASSKSSSAAISDSEVFDDLLAALQKHHPSAGRPPEENLGDSRCLDHRSAICRSS